MGLVSARVALLGVRNREQGVPGALRFLLEQPYGASLLGAVVVGLIGVALVHGVEAATGRRGVAARLGLAVNAIGYAALAWTSARLVSPGEGQFGGARKHRLAPRHPRRGDGARARRRGRDRRRPREAYQGVRGNWSAGRRLPRRLGRILSAVARFGLVARGVVLGALGYFLIRAAESPIRLAPDVRRGAAELLPHRSRSRVRGHRRARARRVRRTALGPRASEAEGLAHSLQLTAFSQSLLADRCEP
jgi:hypothetical protein